MTSVTMSPTRWTEKKLLWLFLGIGVVLRLMLAQAYISNNPFYTHPILDSAFYLDWAHAILEGQSFFPEEYHHPPGYSVFLASVLKLTGENHYAILFLQNLMVGLQSLLIFLCTRMLLGRAAAWFAMILFTLSGLVAFYSMKILSETAGSSLLLVSFYFILKYSLDPRLRFVFLSGLFLGLTMVFRGNAAVCFLPALAAVWFVEKNVIRRLKGFAILTVGLLLFLLPVLYRNVSVAGVWTPVSSNWGENFYLGNNPAASGGFSYVPGIGRNLYEQMRNIPKEAARRAGRPMSSHEAQRFWFLESMKHVREDPGWWISLEGLKVWNLLSREMISGLYFYDLETSYYHQSFRFLFADYGLILPLFFLGLGMVHCLRKIWLPLAYILIQILLMLAFYPELRYMIPVIPFLCIIAGAIGRVNEEVTFTAVRVRLSALLLGLWAVANVLPFHGTGGKEAWYANVASAHFAAEEYGLALERAEAAIEIKPEYADAWVNRGAAYYATGKIDRARQDWVKALDLSPDNFAAVRNLAISHEADNPRIAVQYWQMARSIAQEEGSSDIVRAVDEKIEELSLSLPTEPH